MIYDSTREDDLSRYRQKEKTGDVLSKHREAGALKKKCISDLLGQEKGSSLSKKKAKNGVPPS